MALRTAFLIGAYLLGSVPCGLIIASKAAGVDVRSIGSGNIGATNVLRAAGKIWGVATLLADVAKAAVPAWLALALWPDREEMAAAAGAAALIGHCFPAWLKFRGGKGVACAVGAWLVIAPLALAVGLAVFFGVVIFTKMVSLGSLSLAVVVTLAAALKGAPPAVLVIMLLMLGVIFYRHRANIKRILSRTENRLSQKS